MPLAGDRWLNRWLAAGLIDQATADRIQAYERDAGSEAASPQLRWPIWVALGLGGVLLGAGVLLFVSAHWEELPPWARMTLVVSMVAAFHLGGAYGGQRFAGLGTTLHALGTVSLGGAIAMAGQIFNIQEHWPTGVLLWALGAVAGAWLLRDWPQITITAILVPAWVVAEWKERYRYEDWILSGFVLGLSLTYLSAAVGKEARLWRRCISWLGLWGVLPAALVLAVERSSRDLYTAGWVIAMLTPLGLAVFLRRERAWMNAIAVAWVGGYMAAVQANETLLVVVWCGLGSVGLAAWGIYESRVERVNVGVAGFAITVLYFYFSSLMDALGRSLSLILLGALFLVGGWQLEKVRRQLVARARA